MVKKNQYQIIKITSDKNKHEIVTEFFLKKKKTEYEKSIATEENWHYDIVVHCT